MRGRRLWGWGRWRLEWRRIFSTSSIFGALKKDHLLEPVMETVTKTAKNMKTVPTRMAKLQRRETLSKFDESAPLKESGMASHNPPQMKTKVAPMRKSKAQKCIHKIGYPTVTSGKKVCGHVARNFSFFCTGMFLVQAWEKVMCWDGCGRSVASGYCLRVILDILEWLAGLCFRL